MLFCLFYNPVIFHSETYLPMGQIYICLCQIKLTVGPRGLQALHETKYVSTINCVFSPLKAS